MWNTKLNGICVFRFFVAWLAPGFTLMGAKVATSDSALARIELVCVDPDVKTYSGTFHSHNQKVVQNARGVFMTHVRTRTLRYEKQEWRLSWSKDGGETFTILFSDTHATSPGALETDREGNIYMGRPDFADKNAYLYRFFASENYRRPHISVIPNGAGGKYAMMLDEKRRQIYWICHNRNFSRLDMEGKVLFSDYIFAAKSTAVIGYPHLSLDPEGVLHAAWTTVMVPAPRPVLPIYWDIHYMQSADGGITWRTMAGKPITLPVPADNTGPTERIIRDDEYGVSNWLANMAVKNGKAHFLYLHKSQPPRQNYRRYDLATQKIDADQQPRFKGQTLSITSDGFFATRRNDPRSPLFCVAKDSEQPRLACLVSYDNGKSWQDYAVSDNLKAPYATGGCREITADGWVIGSCTDMIEPWRAGTEADNAKVYFLRIRANAKG